MCNNFNKPSNPIFYFILFLPWYIWVWHTCSIQLIFHNALAKAVDVDVNAHKIHNNYLAQRYSILYLSSVVKSYCARIGWHNVIGRYVYLVQLWQQVRDRPHLWHPGSLHPKWSEWSIFQKVSGQINRNNKYKKTDRQEYLAQKWNKSTAFVHTRAWRQWNTWRKTSQEAGNDRLNRTDNIQLNAPWH